MKRFLLACLLCFSVASCRAESFTIACALDADTVVDFFSYIARIANPYAINKLNDYVLVTITVQPMYTMPPFITFEVHGEEEDEKKKLSFKEDYINTKS